MSSQLSDLCCLLPCCQVSAMWTWLAPLLKKAIANMSIECIHDWGTAFATASVSTVVEPSLLTTDT